MACGNAGQVELDEQPLAVNTIEGKVRTAANPGPFAVDMNPRTRGKKGFFKEIPKAGDTGRGLRQLVKDDVKGHRAGMDGSDVFSASPPSRLLAAALDERRKLHAAVQDGKADAAWGIYLVRTKTRRGNASFHAERRFPQLRDAIDEKRDLSVRGHGRNRRDVRANARLVVDGYEGKTADPVIKSCRNCLRPHSPKGTHRQEFNVHPFLGKFLAEMPHGRMLGCARKDFFLPVRGNKPVKKRRQSFRCRGKKDDLRRRHIEPPGDTASGCRRAGILPPGLRDGRLRRCPRPLFWPTHTPQRLLG